MYSAKTIVQTAIDTINGKYGKIYYKKDNQFQDDNEIYDMGYYHDGIWSFSCMYFVHAMVNGFCADTSKIGGGATIDSLFDENSFLNRYCSIKGKFPISNLKPVSLLKMDTHVGLFIGDRVENGRIINTAEITTSMGYGGTFSWIDIDTGYRYSCKDGICLGLWTDWGEFDNVKYDF